MFSLKFYFNLFNLSLVSCCSIDRLEFIACFPCYLQSSPSLFTSRQRLKTYLFQQSFPDILI